MRIGDDRVKKSTAQQLRRQFDLTMFGDGETIEDYVLHLKGMTAHLNTLGEEVKDPKIVAKILLSLPLHASQTTSSGSVVTSEMDT